MTSQHVFCNSPWYELQIFWDGSLGFCCQANHKIFPKEKDSYYNVNNMSIREWFDSEPMRKSRMMMFDDHRNSMCYRCYLEEDHSDTSRRHRANQKSIIFTKSNFKQSFEQSPGYKTFMDSFNNQGAYDGMPIDLHIDLGNYCNLTCKMCSAEASSSIATQEVRWGIQESKQYIGTDWTRNEEVWNRVVEELKNIPTLTNVHFMGGETLITKRFEDFVDYMILHNRLDLHFSFVTNGTMFNPSLLDKLKKFKRVGIEVSIETLTEHNAYQRQGTDTDLVISNIEKYLEYCNGDSITLTVRPAISALTIGTYHTLLQYCLDHTLIVKAMIVSSPKSLDVRVLPNSIRKQYLNSYYDFIQRNGLEDIPSGEDYNESDPNQIRRVIKNQADQCINLLTVPTLNDSEQQLKAMVENCSRWDSVHGYNARDLYPEFKDILDRYGY
jgi:sulfatase maturation enzyme AslB (radical SAM superfamily)